MTQIIDYKKSQELDFDFEVCRDLGKNTRDKNYTEACDYWNDRIFIEKDCNGFYMFKKILKKGQKPITRLVYKDIKEMSKLKHGFTSKVKQAIDENAISYNVVLDNKDWIIDKQKRLINAMSVVYASTLKDVKVGKEGQEYVELFKTYTHDVFTRGSQRIEKFYNQWACWNLLGLKIGVAILVVSSAEGNGKTTFAKILEHLLGLHNTCHPSISELEKWTWSCYGKRLIVFEETEGLKGDSQVFKNLKNMATNDVFSYEKKGVQGEDMDCVNNIYMTSNLTVPCVGRRYLTIVPSSKWLNRRDLFSKLYDLNDEKIKALYDYFISQYDPKYDFEGEAKKIMEDDGSTVGEIEKMPNVFKFIKEHYVLAKTDGKISTTELYDEYKQEYGVKAFGSRTFLAKMKELGIDKKPSNGKEYYIINYRDLYDELDKRQLFTYEEKFEYNKGTRPETVTKKIVTNDISDNDLKKENEELKKRIAELERLLKAQTEKTEKTEKPVEKTQSEVKKSDESIKIIKVNAFKKN